jgi:hypothetical protein
VAAVVERLELQLQDAHAQLRAQQVLASSSCMCNMC